MFLSGFGSDMKGTKATFLAQQCKHHGFGFLRFDYSGHGQSSGQFVDGTLSLWLDDTLSVLDRLTQGRQIIVGSSMGGWLALLLAKHRPERIKAIIGVAAAPDFTEELIWNKLTVRDKSRLKRHGFIKDKTAAPKEQLPITAKLIKDARNHLILGKSLTLSCPARFLQGMKDTDVPSTHAIKMMAALKGNDISLTLIKNGDHRLSKPHQLKFLWDTILALGTSR